MSQLSGKLGNVALQHGRTVTIQFPMERLYNGRVVVAGIMDTISGEKIEEAPAILGMQFNPGAAPVAHVHLKRVEKPDPLRIYVFSILQPGGPNFFLDLQIERLPGAADELRSRH